MPRTQPLRLFPYSGAKHREAPEILRALWSGGWLEPESLQQRQLAIYEPFGGVAALTSALIPEDPGHGLQVRALIEDLPTSPSLNILKAMLRGVDTEFGRALMSAVACWNSERDALPKSERLNHNIRVDDFVKPFVTERLTAQEVEALKSFFRYSCGGVYLGVHTSNVLYRQHKVSLNRDLWRRMTECANITAQTSVDDLASVLSKTFDGIADTIVYFDPPYGKTSGVYNKVKNNTSHDTAQQLLAEKTARVQATGCTPKVAILSYGEGIQDLVPRGWPLNVVLTRKVARIRAGEGASAAQRPEFCVVVSWAEWAAHFAK